MRWRLGSACSGWFCGTTERGLDLDAQELKRCARKYVPERCRAPGTEKRSSPEVLSPLSNPNGSRTWTRSPVRSRAEEGLPSEVPGPYQR